MKNKFNNPTRLGLIVSISVLFSCSSSKTTNNSSTISNNSMNNMVAIMEVKEPIEGVCNNEYVLAILPLPGNGQIKAIAPKSKEEISIELNQKVDFLKSNTDIEDKGMVSIIVNCKGEMVQCEMSNKTSSKELDNEVVSVFKELKIWQPGSINKKNVDTVVMYSFTVSKGKITLT